MNWLRSKLLRFLFKEAVTLELQDDTAVHVLIVEKHINRLGEESKIPKKKYPSSELKCKIR